MRNKNLRVRSEREEKLLEDLRKALASIAEDTIRVGGDQNVPLKQTADGKLQVSVE